MSCLPSALSQFREKVYWDRFFEGLNGKPFEWYGSFNNFREALAALDLLGAPAEQSGGPLVLHVGCGNSTLPKELYDEGYKRIVNVDFSPVAIEEMKRRFASFPTLEWRCLDVRGRGLQEAFLRDSREAPFDVVIDKGFLDAYISIDHGEAPLPSAGGPQGASPSPRRPPQGPPEASPYDYKKAASEYFEAVFDVLKDGGSFVLISLAQEYILKEFVRFFLTRKVLVDVYPCRSSDKDRRSVASVSQLQPFLIRVKKSIPSAQEQQGAPEVPQCTMAGEPGRGGPETFPLWELTKRVAAVGRWQALDALARVHSQGKRIVLRVGGGAGLFSRCDVAVYDSTNPEHANKGQTAAVLVPPGQELTWTFASPEGNQQVANQLEAARLLVVTFPLGFGSEDLQVFPPLQWRKTIEEAQNTLGPLLKEFALPNNDVIPILTLDEQAPVREVLCQQASPFAGQILVRDVQDAAPYDECVESDKPAGRGTSPAKATRRGRKALIARKERDRGFQRLLRQLVFSCNANTLQSEVRIRVPQGASSADNSKVEFIFQDPASAYYCGVVTAFGFSNKVVAAQWGAPSGVNAVLLGLGGGVLGNLLHYLFSHVGLSLTCVELDQVVIDIAKKFFGFKEKECPLLKVVCGEGKQYVQQLQAESIDLLIIDINSGEAGDVVVCPPKAFAQRDFLEAAKQKLRPGGVLITNLLCRCEDTRAKLLDSFKDHFAQLAVINVPEDVNEVAVAVKESPSASGIQGPISGSDLLKRLQHLERCFLQHTGNKGGWLVGQSMKDWAARVKPWPLPKTSSSGKNGR